MSKLNEHRYMKASWLRLCQRLLIFTVVPYQASLFLLTGFNVNEVPGQPEAFNSGLSNASFVKRSKQRTTSFSSIGPKVLKRYMFHKLSSIPDDLDQKLYVYNPSIVSLPAEFQQKLGVNATYLVSFRVSTQSGCQLDPPDKATNMLGLALLDASLNFLSDFVVDINSDTGWKRAGYYNDQSFQDFRLFLLENKLHLTDGVWLLPIAISPQRFERRLKKLYASSGVDSFTLIALSGGRRIRSWKDVTITKAVVKNHNFWQIENKTFMEIFPTSNRLVAEVDVQHVTLRETFSSSGEKMPSPSFSTLSNFTDTIPFKFSADRGSACCVLLEKEYHEGLTENVYIGLAHAKTLRKIPRSDLNLPDSFHYLTRIYAFSPNQPFELVATSGLFCFPSKTEDTLLLYNRQFKYCPRIQFVSGMATSVLHPNHIIITYGVNDCHSEMILVDKKDLARTLFG